MTFFLLQAMGVYLYGELMLNEDAKQQEIAYKTFATIRDQMDTSSAKVVAEMLSDKVISRPPPPDNLVGHFQSTAAVPQRLINE